MHSLLIANPNAQYNPFWKLRVGEECSDDLSEKYMVNGDETNTAIFWPEYFKCDTKLYDVNAASRIVASTILMGGELNSYGVRGLEIWHYDKSWKRLPSATIDDVLSRFDELKKNLERSITS